ncbi:hypothetical protein NST07_12485 [Paenibacillus sp. FSL L8-0340]|uniref:hypothetical protein n=1 Tax=Paenibacillus sp. FSL L8-0340 TaxID=2954685 RepID=UPI00315804FD
MDGVMLTERLFLRVKQKQCRTISRNVDCIAEMDLSQSKPLPSEKRLALIRQPQPELFYYTDAPLAGEYSLGAGFSSIWLSQAGCPLFILIALSPNPSEKLTLSFFPYRVNV